MHAVRQIYYSYWIVAIFLVGVASTCLADPPPAIESLDELAITNQQSSLDSLQAVDRTIIRLKDNLKQQQDMLGSPDSKGREAEINSNIIAIAEKINLLEDNFRQLSANVDLDSLNDIQDNQEFSLVNEFEKLIKPLLTKLTAITELPREIENLRSDVNLYQERLATIDSAQQNTEKLLQVADLDKSVSKRLKASIDFWEEQQKSVATSLAITEQKLKARIGQQTPIGESLSNAFQTFFKTRGRNIALAVFFSALFFLLLRKLFNSTQQSAYLRQQRFSNYNKIILLIYIILSAIGTTLIFIAVLYLSGDWLLLTVALLLLLGFLWASRETLPRHWAELLLLFNMGPVREGEVVTLNGLLWKVNKLNLYTQLINTALEPPIYKVPAMDLLSLRSRITSKNESFFPTNKGDWVLIDGKHCQVTLQTPNVVQVTERGGAETSYPTLIFVAQEVTNLSNGFRSSTSFGIDYKHSNEITKEIPLQLKEYVLDQLAMNNYNTSEIRSSVEFESAASSSLNLAVILDFPGKYAGDYIIIRRLISRLCVEASNKYGWTIPFDQLRVHLK